MISEHVSAAVVALERVDVPIRETIATAVIANVRPSRRTAWCASRAWPDASWERNGAGDMGAKKTQRYTKVHPRPLSRFGVSVPVVADTAGR